MTSRKKNAGSTGADRGTVAGLFRDQRDAEHAIRDLKDAGIDETRIGVAMLDRGGQRELAEDTTGRILGGAVGLLAGVGALAIPGLGPIIAGGALASTLAGAGIGTAAGALLGALVTMGVPEDDARYFETGLRHGSVLVTATVGSRGQEAREILRGSGANLGDSSREAAGNLELFESREEILVEDEEDAGSAGDLARETWRGSERRYHDDVSYSGPERRYSHH
jgi:hypothetical protein